MTKVTLALTLTDHQDEENYCIASCK